MSLTVSRGIHTRERWRSPALAVLDGIRGKTTIAPGALAAIERLLSWILAGIAFDEKRELDPKIRLMSAICALSIALKIYHPGVLDPSILGDVKRRTEKNLDLIRNAETELRIRGTPSELQELQKFLSALAA